MKKYISYLLTLALIVPAFVSCTQERDFLSRKQKTHTVHFATTEPATRTGLTIEDNMVKPDWRKTDNENVHFFEIDANNDVAYGVQEDEISLSSDNRTAHFKAVISEEVVIHIDPSTGEEDNSKGAKSSSRVSPFTFAAVVAQKEADAYTFVIPYEQHPDAETLKDPNAEFLVGYSRKSYTEQYDYESDFVDLYFDRVAALGRLAISGFIGTGEKVKSVTITANGGMTGEATYPGDFTLGDKNKVNFTKVDEPLVLNYGENGVAAPAEDPFYAYFVAVPGEATVTSIEVLTDQYKYTKTVAQGAKFTFSDEQLLNIDFDLSGAIAEAVTEDNNTWYKASMLEDGYDYIIVSSGKAMSTDGSTLDVATIPTPANGEIEFQTPPGTDIIWTADYEPAEYATGKKAGDYKLQNGNVYLQRKNQSYDLTVGGAPDNHKYYVFDYDGEHLWHLTTGQNNEEVKYYFYYNTSWTSESEVHVTELYTSRPPIEISFASAEAKFDLDNEEWTVAIPELTAPEGAVVTYSSSDEDIATVAADGTVTPKAVGSAVITATVTGGAEYQGGAASYILEVTSSKVQTFYLASEIQAGTSYIVVSGGSAMTVSGTTLGVVGIMGSAGDAIITLAQNATPALFEAAEHVEYYSGTSPAGHYTLSNGGKYLQRKNNKPAIDDIPSTKKYYVWEYNGHQLYHLSNATNTFYVGLIEDEWDCPYQTTSSSGASGTNMDYSYTYLYTTTRPLPSRNLSFPQATYTAQMGTSFTAPELGGVTTGVKYKSSDTGVATVNEDTGAINLVAAGTTTITASADATDEYAAGSAQYTLTVSAAAGTEKYYVLVTSEPASWNGKYLIVNTAADGTGSAMNGTGTANVTISGGKILSTSTVDGYALTVTSAGEVHPNQLSGESLIAYDIQFNDNYYLFWFSSAFKYSENQQTGRDGLTYYRCTLKYDNGVRIMSAGYPLSETYTPGQYYLYYQSSGSYTMSNSQSSSRVQLYKLDEGGDSPTPTPQPQSLNFPQAAYTTQMGTSFSAPTVSGAKTSVEYASSNTSVATVNATSGAVTLVAAGETTITATAPAGTVNGVSYTAGSAQYTLTVSAAPEPGTEKVYKKVTSQNELVADGTYLIVYENGADSKVFKPIRDGSSFTTSTANAEAVTISNNTITSSVLDNHTVVFRNADGNNKFAMWVPAEGCYMILRNDTASFVADNTNEGYRATFTVNSGNVTIVRSNSGSSSSYYFRYSATNSYFQVSTNTGNVALYKLDDGSSPGGGDDPGDDPTPTTSTYSQVSFATGITTGKYLIVNPADTHVFNTSTNASNAVAVSVSGGVISGDYSSYELTITKSGENYTIQNGSNQYLYYNYNQGDQRVGYQNGVNNWTVSAGSDASDTNAFRFTSSNQNIYWNNTYFRIGGTGTTGVHLYKKADNP